MVVNKVTFTRLFAEAWERSIRLPVTGICPVSPGCLPEMAFATCFQEVSVAISVGGSKKVIAGEISQKKASSFYGVPVIIISDQVQVILFFSLVTL